MLELIEVVVLVGHQRGAAGGLGSVAAHPLPGLKRVPGELFAAIKEMVTDAKMGRGSGLRTC